MPGQSRQQKINNIKAWAAANQGRRDSGWVADVEEDTVPVKFDHQLVKMAADYDAKGRRLARKFQRLQAYPEYFKGLLRDNFSRFLSGANLEAAIEEEFDREYKLSEWKSMRLDQAYTRIVKEQELRARGQVQRDPIGTTYYVDAQNGSDGNAGTSTGAAWASLDKAVESTMTGGDVIILRRVDSSTYDYFDGVDNAGVLSDGSFGNPIVLTADYGDEDAIQNGDYFDAPATSDQTYTLTPGSKVLVASASITNISPGDWVYANGDTPGMYLYQVAAVSGTDLTLYLPYKGDQSGSGVSLKVFSDTPTYGTTSGAQFIAMNSDYYWLFRGIHVRSNINLNYSALFSCSNGFTAYRDCIAECASGNVGNGFGGQGNDPQWMYLDKCRLINGHAIANYGSHLGAGFGRMRDCLGTDNDYLIRGGQDFGLNVEAIDCEMTGNLGVVSSFANDFYSTNAMRFRNIISADSSGVRMNDNENVITRFSHLMEYDYDGNIGQYRAYGLGGNGEDDAVLLQEETTTVRSGGGAISLKVSPQDNVSLVGAGAWEYTELQCMEIPLYLPASSKTISIYFRPTATTDWTADPTADELYIELEYYCHASNAFRKRKRSTGTIDMNGSTAWQALSVSATPGQAGEAILRVVYAKSLEASKANTFFLDPVPVVA